MDTEQILIKEVTRKIKNGFIPMGYIHEDDILCVIEDNDELEDVYNNLSSSDKYEMLESLTDKDWDGDRFAYDVEEYLEDKK